MAAKILPLVGLARSKQDPINRGHSAQYLYRPPPAGAILHLPLGYPVVNHNQGFHHQGQVACSLVLKQEGPAVDKSMNGFLIGCRMGT
jgi:hypothetical protein